MYFLVILFFRWTEAQMIKPRCVRLTGSLISKYSNQENLIRFYPALKVFTSQLNLSLSLVRSFLVSIKSEGCPPLTVCVVALYSPCIRSHSLSGEGFFEKFFWDQVRRQSKQIPEDVISFAEMKMRNIGYGLTPNRI